MLLQTILYWLSIIAIVVTSLLVLYSNRRPVFINYSLFTIGIAIWLAFQFFIDNSIMPLVNAGLGLIFIHATVGFFVLFSYSFPDNKILPKKYLTLPFIGLFIFAPFSFSPDMIYLNDTGELQYGWIYTFHTASLLILLTIGLLLLIKRYFTLGITEKGQLQLLLLAFIPFLIGSFLTGVTLPQEGDLQFIRPLSALIMVLIIIYAMVNKKLFDIKLIVIRGTAYMITVLFLILIYVGPILYLFMIFMGMQLDTADFLLLMLLITLLATNYSRIKNWFNKITNQVFFRDTYNAQDVINVINSTLVNEIEVKKILPSISEIIERNIKTSFVNFYLEPKSSISFHLSGTNTSMFNKKEWTELSEILARNDNKILLEDRDKNSTEYSTLMKALGIECAIIMQSGDDNVGYMLVGPRKSGNKLTDSDIQLLEIIADEVAIVVQNLLRFEEIKRFNITLRQKIDSATAELQQTNKKLKSLDEAKDEFISMASHQLRTPLTSIKGYISMMLEGDAGDLNDQQKNFLNQAFISSQRMVFLISDLLNVSRLKTGKFVIEKSDVDLSEMVQSEVEQLNQTAEARGLTLEFNPPKDFPVVQLDETKTLQVIMNFIDNAIYYTPKAGKIKIELTVDDKSVTYKVTDTGIGVPKAVQHDLFTKFFRAENAKKARPDGTGLGLYMAKKVIIAQGGHLIFESQEGKGSTFGFSFPVNTKN